MTGLYYLWIQLVNATLTVDNINYFLEPERNSPNVAHFPSSVLRPGERYDEWCVYKFGVK